jgi:hypothetical protein
MWDLYWRVPNGTVWGWGWEGLEPVNYWEEWYHAERFLQGGGTWLEWLRPYHEANIDLNYHGC